MDEGIGCDKSLNLILRISSHIIVGWMYEDFMEQNPVKDMLLQYNFLYNIGYIESSSILFNAIELLHMTRRDRCLKKHKSTN